MQIPDKLFEAKAKVKARRRDFAEAMKRVPVFTPGGDDARRDVWFDTAFEAVKASISLLFACQDYIAELEKLVSTPAVA